MGTEGNGLDHKHTISFRCVFDDTVRPLRNRITKVQIYENVILCAEQGIYMYFVLLVNMSSIMMGYCMKMKLAKWAITILRGKNIYQTKLHQI